MSSSGMLRRVALVRTKVSVEHIISIISVKRFSELGTTLSLTINRSTLRRNTNTLTLVFHRIVLKLIVIAKDPSSLVVSALLIETIRCSETSCSYKNHTVSRPRIRHSSSSSKKFTFPNFRFLPTRAPFSLNR
jgi:hypothetical protein